MIDNDVVKIKLDNDEAIMFTGVDYEDITDTLQVMSKVCKWLIIKNIIINIDRIMYIEKVEKDKEVE